MRIRSLVRPSGHHSQPDQSTDRPTPLSLLRTKKAKKGHSSTPSLSPEGAEKQKRGGGKRNNPEARRALRAITAATTTVEQRNDDFPNLQMLIEVKEVSKSRHRYFSTSSSIDACTSVNEVLFCCTQPAAFSITSINCRVNESYCMACCSKPVRSLDKQPVGCFLWLQPPPLSRVVRERRERQTDGGREGRQRALALKEPFCGAGGQRKRQQGEEQEEEEGKGLRERKGKKGTRKEKEDRGLL